MRKRLGFLFGTGKKPVGLGRCGIRRDQKGMQAQKLTRGSVCHTKGFGCGSKCDGKSLESLN